MPQPRLVIPLADYQRIFRVIFTVLDERAHTHAACIFFAMVGAEILRQHYNVKAIPVSGAAAFAVSEDDSLIATFGKIENRELISAGDAFHCWVECNGYAIDFMAPLFHESLRASGHQCSIRRRMFQRPIDQMDPMLTHFTHEGAFHLVPDLEQSKAMLANFNARPASTDLANICVSRYKRPPKRINETFDIQDDLDKITKLKLNGPELSGVW